jgi:hypothetical protein
MSYSRIRNSISWALDFIILFVQKHVKFFAGFTVWFAVLEFIRPKDMQLAELYVLFSMFFVVYLIGFTPRQPGELSAYSHFNENYQRLAGDLDPRRAGRELTGQIVLDSAGGSEEEWEGKGNVLGHRREDQEDEDLQRALLLSLHDAREARKRH